MRELRVAGILLDMDGTLADSTALVELLWAEFAATHGLDLAALLEYSHGRPSIDTIAHFLPGLPSAEQWRLREAIEADGLVRTGGIVEVPGAADFLRRVADARLPHALVTSAPAALAARRLAAAGVRVPEVQVTADDIVNGKPHPEPFMRGAEALGLPSARLAAFEDSAAGLASALAAGTQAVVVGGFAGAEAAGLPRVRDWRDVAIEQVGDGGFLLRIADDSVEAAS